MGFSIQLGVSGFRMDAVPFVISTKGPDVEDAAASSTTCCVPSVKYCDGVSAIRMILAEANVLSGPICSISAMTEIACT